MSFELNLQKVSTMWNHLFQKSISFSLVSSEKCILE
jgi:hypothetical protein